ncbi:MAG TPA: NfeD family protein [Terriglobales bacterium]|nr:NfeD family protein [Terriglobales bacterium]
MTWADFYLICFAVGFAFSFLSFVLGGLNWHVHGLHLPHSFGHTTGGHAGHPGGAAHAPSGHGGAEGQAISPFNLFTLTAFLAWFGGTGYLLTRFSTIWFFMGLLWSVIAGLVGASLVFLFMSKILISKEENMDPADYDMVGVLGKTSSPIRQGGTGEIIYSQAGTRRTCGARSEDGSAIAKGDEVIVTRYEKGIAYVRRWEEMAGEEKAESAGQ